MTDITNRSASTEFLFFASNMRLISECNSSASGAEPSGLKTLAGKLIARPPARPSVNQFARASLDGEARLLRAQTLLHDVEAVTAREQGAIVRDAWHLLDEEWRFLKDAAPVREILCDWAQQAGLADPAAAAQTVLHAIDGELLPILHIKWHLRADTPAMKTIQETLLARWQDASALTPAAAHLYSLWCCDARAGRETSIVDQLARCESLLQDPGLEFELKQLVAERYAELGGLQSRVQHDNLTWLGQQLQVVEALEQSLEPLHPLLDLRAKLHQRYGIAILNSHFLLEDRDIRLRTAGGGLRAHTGILHLAQAIVLAPDDKESALQLSRVGELFRVFDALRQQVQGNAEVIEILETLCQDLTAGGQEAEAFLHSVEADELRARRAAAVVRTGPLRMHDVLRQRFVDDQQDAAALARPTQAARTVLYTWTFSARQPLFKAVAALGLLLLVHAGTVGIYQRYQARVCDQNYQDLLVSAKAGQADRAIVNAESFLSHANTSDPRLSQILDIYHRAVLDRLFALGGHSERVKPLLKRHDNLLARFQPQPMFRKEN